MQFLSGNMQLFLMPTIPTFQLHRYYFKNEEAIYREEEELLGRVKNYDKNKW
jgi:hypothetical protein